MASDIFERRARFLSTLIMLDAARLRQRQEELTGKAQKTADEEEEIKLLGQILTMLKNDHVPETRSLGSWIVEELLAADTT